MPKLRAPRKSNGRSPHRRARKRDDTVGWMYQHAQLERDDDRDGGDAKARLMAARRFQALYECAEIGGAKAIDITRDVVEGGGAILHDRARQEAINQLKVIWNKIGQFRSNLVGRVLGEKRTLVEVAAMLLGVEVPTDRRERSTLKMAVLGNLLMALDELADHFGVRPKRDGREPRRDRKDKLAPIADEGGAAGAREAVNAGAR